MRSLSAETISTGSRVFFIAMTRITPESPDPAAFLTPAAGAYGALAPFYDRFTAGHDYERWTTTLEPLARAHGLAGRRLLDVACGTGKSFAAFLRRGYDVVACDVSPEMAAQARERGGGAVDVRVCDMRALPRLGAFDLVTCLGDSVNYLTDPMHDLPRAFAAAAANLRPGGVYLFDVNTLFTYRSWYLADHRSEDEDGLVFEWRGARHAPIVPGTLATATVAVLTPGGERHDAGRHVQRHHPLPVLRAALLRAGFDAVTAHGQDGTGALRGDPDEDTLTKTIVIARRSSEPLEPPERR